jgi:hypothetical protein
MITLPLSNNTELTITINLKDRAVNIRQVSKQRTLEPIVPDSVIVIPMTDLKDLVKSIKTLVSFFS